jgi:hypothetical protein
MKRRQLLISSIGAVTSLPLVGGAAFAQKDDAELRVAEQLEPRLELPELQERFRAALGTLGKEGLAEKMRESARPMDATRVASAIKSAQTSVETIFAGRREFSPPYRWSLEVDLRVFESFRETLEKSQRFTLSAINNVTSAATDLALKAGLAGKNGRDMVEVTVHTFKDGAEVPGCRVLYAPYMHDDEQHRIKFDKFSSPTTDFLPPGKWLIWAVKNKVEGPKDEFYCGDDKRPTRTIHIDAP